MESKEEVKNDNDCAETKTQTTEVNTEDAEGQKVASSAL